MKKALAALAFLCLATAASAGPETFPYYIARDTTYTGVVNINVVPSTNPAEAFNSTDGTYLIRFSGGKINPFKTWFRGQWFGVSLSKEGILAYENAALPSKRPDISVVRVKVFRPARYGTGAVSTGNMSDTTIVIRVKGGQRYERPIEYDSLRFELISVDSLADLNIEMAGSKRW